MIFNCDRKENLVVCSVSGEIDMYAAPEFHERYRTIATKESDCDIVFDLSKTTYMDSSGIGVLFQIFSDAKLRERGFCICNVTGMVEKLFKLSHMNSILPIENDIVSAIKRARGLA